MAERIARINGRAEVIEQVSNCLPHNYQAHVEGSDIIITGMDHAGWTLDGYVIPRLASGLFFAKEEAQTKN